MIAGLLAPILENPRMALSAHLIGITGGAFILGIGAAWPHMRLGPRTVAVAFWTLLYSIYANWLTVLFAGFWGVGAQFMPIAGGEHDGGGWQNVVVAFGLASLSLTSMVTAVLLIYGLRGKVKEND